MRDRNRPSMIAEPLNELFFVCFPLAMATVDGGVRFVSFYSRTSAGSMFFRKKLGCRSYGLSNEATKFPSEKNRKVISLLCRQRNAGTLCERRGTCRRGPGLLAVEAFWRRMDGRSAAVRAAGVSSLCSCGTEPLPDLCSAAVPYLSRGVRHAASVFTVLQTGIPELSHYFRMAAPLSSLQARPVVPVRTVSCPCCGEPFRGILPVSRMTTLRGCAVSSIRAGRAVPAHSAARAAATGAIGGTEAAIRANGSLFRARCCG